MPTSRRTFLKLGVFSAMTLAAAGLAYRSLRKPPPATPFALDPEARTALRAISATILKGVIDKDNAAALDAAIGGTLKAISGLSLAAQKELSDLFGMLVMAPSRRLLVGLSTPWAEAKQEDIARFLDKWRMHRIGLLQAAYFALHDLILGAWYGEPANWAAINYPGPLKELS